MGSPRRKSRVRDVVARSYAVVLVAFAVVVSISLGMGLLSIARFDPLRARYSDATGGVSRMHQGLFDQQTGLRGYLLTLTVSSSSHIPTASRCISRAPPPRPARLSTTRSCGPGSSP